MYYLLPITYYLKLPITYYLKLPITYYLKLPITYYLKTLLITRKSYLILFPSCPNNNQYGGNDEQDACENLPSKGLTKNEATHNYSCERFEST